VDRVQKLLEQKRLSGVTDDRGKFIHITEAEYMQIAKFIKAKGRVSRADILKEANRIVRMGPKASDKKRIEEE
jgi:hypothetical protein